MREGHYLWQINCQSNSSIFQTWGRSRIGTKAGSKKQTEMRGRTAMFVWYTFMPFYSGSLAKWLILCDRESDRWLTSHSAGTQVFLVHGLPSFFEIHYQESGDGEGKGLAVIFTLEPSLPFLIGRVSLLDSDSLSQLCRIYAIYTLRLFQLETQVWMHSTFQHDRGRDVIQCCNALRICWLWALWSVLSSCLLTKLQCISLSFARVVARQSFDLKQIVVSLT